MKNQYFDLLGAVFCVKQDPLRVFMCVCACVWCVCVVCVWCLWCVCVVCVCVSVCLCVVCVCGMCVFVYVRTTHPSIDHMDKQSRVLLCVAPVTSH